MDKPDRPLIPPHLNAEVHARLMRKWRSMTREEFWQTLVNAGIGTADGDIAEPYKSAWARAEQDAERADAAPSPTGVAPRR